MAQPDHHENRPAAERDRWPWRLARYHVLGAARGLFERSVAQRFVLELKAVDFSNQIMLFGAGMLLSLFPFFILLSAFASRRIDDDIALYLGMDRRASEIVTHLLTPSPASLNVATVTSLVFVTAGTIAIAGSLQQLYEKVFRQAHRGTRGLYRLLIWVPALSAVIVAEGAAGRPVRGLSAGAVLAVLVTFAILTPFFWWTMHFLLAGRVSWRRLVPSAVATGVLCAGLGIFSTFYFSSTIIHDSRTYGSIGAIFGIMTWFVAIGAVLLLGAVAGAVWNDSRASPRRSSSGLGAAGFFMLPLPELPSG